MAFPRETLVAGIAIANKLTAGVQEQFTLAQWTAKSYDGALTFANSAVTLSGVVDKTRKQKVNAMGKVIAVVATVTVIGDIAPGGAAGRFEPVDPDDLITLADGTTGPIVSSPGSVDDPVTTRGLIHVIEIGEVG